MPPSCTAQQNRVTPSVREVPMRTYHHMVPSLGPLLFILALLATMGCDGDPSSDPGADRGDVGPAPDAATADRATPPEDHPVVTSDAGSNDAADASTPPDASSPDVVMPPPDVTPPEDHVTPPDAAVTYCPMGTLPEPTDHCVRLPPGMAPSDFVYRNNACGTSMVTVIWSGGSTDMRLDCRSGIDGVLYIDLRPFIPGTGFAPCIGNMCIVYTGPTTATRAVLWGSDPSPCGARTVMWPAGVDPNTAPPTDITGGSYALCPVR